MQESPTIRPRSPIRIAAERCRSREGLLAQANDALQCIQACTRVSECAPARFSGLQCGPPLLAHDGCAALSCGEGLCICELENCIAEKPGLFREQLMREDTARLRKLEALARSTAEPESYRRA